MVKLLFCTSCQEHGGPHTEASPVAQGKLQSVSSVCLHVGDFPMCL